MAEQRAFGFVLGVGAASVVAAATMFWIARNSDGRSAARATYTDIESYCAARVQSSSGEERGLHETTCRLTLNGALDSLAAHRYVDAIDQIRAVDALLRDQPTPAPIASAALPAPVRDERPLVAERPARAEASLPKRVRSKESNLMDPFASAPVAPVVHSKREPPLTDLTDPFAARRDDAIESTPVAAQAAPAPARRQTRSDDLFNPFANSH